MAELPEPTPKSEDGLERIASAVRANFLFRKLPADKATAVFGQMRKRATAEGEVVFSQGEMGDTFYDLEEGEYVVSLQRPGEAQPTDLFTYAAVYPHGANTCFGELASIC